jgi:sua5/yciO/yrdC/ywlC family protein
MKIKEIVKLTLPFLQENKVILYPTDTIWGLGCDAYSYQGIERIRQIKRRDINKNFILLVSSLGMLKQYVKIPSEIVFFLKSQTRPTSVIYQEVCNSYLPLAKDNSLAFRIVQDEFCRELIKAFGKPIISTSANISGEPSPMTFSQISEEIKNLVDYIVPYHQQNQEGKAPSQLVKIEEGEIIFLRK